MQNRAPSTDELLDLVDAIYASAMEPDRMRAALRGLSDLIGGTCAQIFIFDRRDGSVLHSQMGGTGAACEEANRQYASRWGALDPRAALLATLPPGEILRCHEHFDEKFVSASPFYQDFLIEHGFRWTVGGLFDSGADTATVVAGLRAPGRPPFEDWTAASLRLLLPHFRKASLIRDRLDRPSEVTGVVEMLKALPMPCVFTDAAGRCIERNQAFGEAMEMLALRVVVGRLRFSNPQLHETWDAALSVARTTALAQTVNLTVANGRPWRLHLIPVRSVMQGGDRVDRKTILAIFDERPFETQSPPAAVASRSRLTNAELDVLAGLLQGLPAKAIANHRGASVNTVRSQIMSILEKTGHSSQKELIASFGASTFGASSFGPSTFGR